MKKIKIWYIKNEMLGANFLANFIGVFFVNGLMTKTEQTIPNHLLPTVSMVDNIFTFSAFTFVCIITLVYEKPIRYYLNRTLNGIDVDEDQTIVARRRLLNEPFFLMAMDLSMWLLAAIVYPVMFKMLNAGTAFIERSLFISLTNGFITVTVAFFLLEHVLQKHLAPYFFPNGGMSRVSRTLRIRIRTRLTALLFACSLIPLFSIMRIVNRMTADPDITPLHLEALRSTVLINAIIFMVTGIALTLLVIRNLSLPFKDIIRTLQGVRKGRFDARIKVASNDEIGYTGDVINEMTEGLQERDRMRQSLYLAKEVQQNLLPRKNLNIHGLEIAGKSIYCDETGGDYYDYLVLNNGHNPKIAVAIGDVSGHGIPSALLMATVRSALRQRAAMPGTPAEIIADVNRQLVADVEDSGQFMTLFYLMLDTSNHQIEWVRAGHDPAVIYNPITAVSEELIGTGVALGVDAGYHYRYQTRAGLSDGELALLTTDGLWELRNAEGKMMGRNPILKILQQHASASAKEILDAIFRQLHEFADGSKIEDDITAVVIKAGA